jgi:sterol 14-demethylase
MAITNDLQSPCSLPLADAGDRNGVLLLENHTPYVVIICLILPFACFMISVSLRRPSLPLNAPPIWKHDDWPVLGAVRFFTHRTDMVLEAVAAHESCGSRTGNFSFFLGKKHIVGIGHAQSARTTFYDSRDMDLLQA